MTNLKTISKDSLVKKINALNLKSNSILLTFLTKLKNGETILRPIFSRGNTWNTSKLEDYSMILKKTLNDFNINYDQGNDAPRGGKTGYYIKVLTKVK